mgnify:CR=1 FL=1
MDNDSSFDEPVNIEPDGTYITAGQLQFFFNRDFGKEKFESRNSEFMEYYDLCRVYNLVSDIMEDDEDSAIMYWDEKKEIISLGFPASGLVAHAMSGINAHGFMEESDDDDEHWGFSGSGETL